MFKKFLFIIIISLFFNVFLYTNTFAVISDSDMTLEITPKYPQAGDSINASVKSYLIEVDKSYFIWYLNEETKLSGVGRNNFIFTMPNNLSYNNLKVQIQTQNGQTFTKEMNLYSGGVDLLWEASNSYVPPFYKGKTLFPNEGEVKVVAIPSFYSENNKQSPHVLSYEWEKDGFKTPYASGFGKNFFTYKNTFLDNSNKIKVLVSDLNQETQISHEITIYPLNPKIVFYKKNNIGIKMEKSLDNNSYINKEGETIVAVPYFFSPSFVYSSDLDISWSINGENMKTEFKDEISVKPENNTSGEAIISVFVANTKTLFQELEKSIKVNF